MKRIGIILWLVVGLVGCSSNSSKSRYILAEKLWNEGKYSASVAEFEKVIAKDPRGDLGVQALFRAATTETLFLNRHESAVTKFNSISEITQDPVLKWEAMKQAAEILFSKLEHHELALRKYQQMIALQPNGAEVPEYLFKIARSHFFLSHYEEALAGYSEIQKKFSETPWAERAQFQSAASIYTRGGPEGFQEAMDHYQRFLKEHPQSSFAAEARFGIASCLEEMDQLDSAYHQYEALLKNYPSPNVIRIKMARIRERQAQKSR